MKKTILFVFMTVFLCMSVWCEEPNQEKENPMASFMGAKWGQNVNEFLNTFSNADKLKKYQGFYLVNFKLGDTIIKEIDFNFSPKGEGKVKFKKNNYDQLFFSEVIFHITPDQYDEIFDIFVLKYGEPFKKNDYEIQNRMGAKFQQKESIWVDTDIERMIYAIKYRNQIDEGKIFFIKYDPNLTEDKDKKKKNAADQL